MKEAVICVVLQKTRQSDSTPENESSQWQTDTCSASPSATLMNVTMRRVPCCSCMASAIDVAERRGKRLAGTEHCTLRLNDVNCEGSREKRDGARDVCPATVHRVVAGEK